MAEAFTPVNPQKVKVICCGIPVTQYRGMDQYVAVRPLNDLANSTGGADADVATVLNLLNTGEMTVRVFKNSPTYKLLRAAAVAFQTTGIFAPSSVIDLNDPLDTCYAQQSYIKRHSDDIYSTNSADLVREYTIFMANILRI